MGFGSRWTGSRFEKPLFDDCLGKVSSRDELKTCSRCSIEVCSKCAPSLVCKQCTAAEEFEVRASKKEHTELQDAWKKAELKFSRKHPSAKMTLWDLYTKCECEKINADLGSSEDCKVC